jgi:ABC-type transport system substrate-binding protein
MNSKKLKEKINYFLSFLKEKIFLKIKNFWFNLLPKDRIFFSLFLIIFLISFFWLLISFYLENTKIVPAKGGTFIEGVIGQPKFLNPIYLGTSDIDRDIIELIFSGLFKYDKDGNIIPDLAKNFEIKEEGKVFEITLKDDIFWQDGQKLTPDDVIFTINLIQNPQYQSSLISKFAGVKVEKISDNSLRFTLKDSYYGFLENLTVKIIPKHIFENLPPEELIWGEKEIKKIIGTGPFKLKDIIKDEKGRISKIILERNQKYYDKKPYLDKIIFKFFNNENDLISFAKKNKISGFYIQDYRELTQEKFFQKNNNFLEKEILMPRYFALFFNLLAKENTIETPVREAIESAINKKEIIEKVFNGKAKELSSPFLPEYFGLKEPEEKEEFNLQKANEILERAGYFLDQNLRRVKKEEIINQDSIKSDLKLGSKGKEVENLQKCLQKFPDLYHEDVTGYFGKSTKEAVIAFQEKYKDELLKPINKTKGDGIVSGLTKAKINQLCFSNQNLEKPLEITITTLESFPLKEIAELIKNQLEKIGIIVNLRVITLGDLQTKILPEKDFQIILLGEAYNSILDPFSYWHSSQIDYPGLNIIGYASKKADEILEKIRKTKDENEKKDLLEKLQDVILEDIPVISLLQPNFSYFVSKKFKGIEINKIVEPSKRFSNINEWYLKTKRVFYF